MPPKRKHRSTRKGRNVPQDHQVTTLNQSIANERYNSFNKNKTVGLDSETGTSGSGFFVEDLLLHDPSYEHTAIIKNSSLWHPLSGKAKIHHGPINYNASSFVNNLLISQHSATNVYPSSSATHNQVQNQTQPQIESQFTTFMNIIRQWGHETINSNSNINAIPNHIHQHQTPTPTNDISPLGQWENSSMHDEPWNALASIPVYGGQVCGLEMEMDSDGDRGAGEGEEGGSMIYYAPSSQYP